MSRLLSMLARSVAIGVGATAVMDLGGEVVRKLTGVEPLDYRLLGRWIGHMREGKLKHDNIRTAEPVPHEREIGWVAHYSIGTAFAGALVATHPTWSRHPTLVPAMIAGLATTAAPWFIMQPAFGMGVAASKTPDPTVARLRSVRAHAFYGVGLYLAGNALTRLARPRNGC
ncbi:DUF2938 domain-containing protein [Saccharothrix algeriensis]|uniref:DUF2938 domain-containing protein n=1 Tax=Saccharothrix algeriensis TaxID=173560 RepID=A0A8T8HX26_9PSEU|nr:DUF2938 domain-containing protein [Saccharothrix algeriensis]MBM7814786.1 hypothetical protein [Saccharothrix algeriensis]QTR03058.1 DUF2938 domain-containing protein [Saccharothrix algeriensis]